MKAFFSTTPRAKTQYKKEVELVYGVMRELGLEMTDEYIERATEDEFYSMDAKRSKEYYDSTMRNIKRADVAIFEVSVPSLGVGHLIGQALNFGKPVIVLFVKGKKPFMLESAHLDKVLLVEYTPQTLKEELQNALEYAKEITDVRFNFFITPELSSYLDWVTKNRGVPRSVFLRSIIEEHLRRDKGYQERQTR